jgi:hypothetical protein
MDGFRSKVPALGALCERQDGVVSREQLLALGLTAGRIESWVRHGRLHVRHRGVYAVGRRELSRQGEWLAALLACGPAAVLSHGSAAALHGMAADAGGAVHVSTTAHGRSRPGLVVHRTRHLEPADVVTLGSFRVTRRPRTLVDLADVLPSAELRAVVDGLRRLDLRALAAAQSRAPNRRGAASVTRLLLTERRRTRSELERRFGRFCAAHGLPRPDATNVREAGHEVDAVYVGARLAVELDGRAHHERRAQMRADRRRDADLQLAGWRVLRLVWEQLDRHEGPATARIVAALLALSA